MRAAERRLLRRRGASRRSADRAAAGAVARGLPAPAGSRAVAAPPARPSAALLASLEPAADLWVPPACPPPDVSVIVRFYNGRRGWLSEAIESVLGQEGVSVEVIVVDDGSDEALEPYSDERVGLLRFPYNRGLGAARNEAVRRARGEWVTMLDYDDERLPGSLAAQVDAGRAARAGLVIAGLEVSDVPGARDSQREELRRVWDGRPESLRDLMLDYHNAQGNPANLISCGGLVWRRDAFDVSAPADYISCDDYAVAQQLLLAASPEDVVFLDAAVYRYRRVSPTSDRGSAGPEALPGGPLRRAITEYCVHKTPALVRYHRLAARLERPLRVVFVEREFGMGGAQWQIAQLARHSDPRVLAVTLLCELPSPLAAWLARRGRYVRVKPPDCDWVPWLADQLAELQPDVLDGSWYPHAARFVRDPPCPVYVHAAGMAALWEAREPELTDRIDRIICESQAVADAHPEWGERRVVIPNAVDVDAFRASEHRRPGVRAALGLPQDAVVVSFCGRMTASEKRIGLLREMIARLAEERPTVWWLVAGWFSPHLPNHGALSAEWETFIADKPVRWIADMQPWLAPAFHVAADVSFCCSSSEGLSLATLEAMAAGCVVVTSDAGGQREAVVPGTGYVVPVADAEGLYRALLLTVDLPPSERRRMGLFARYVCAGKFHIAENARRHALAYAAAVG